MGARWSWAWRSGGKILLTSQKHKKIYERVNFVRYYHIYFVVSISHFVFCSFFWCCIVLYLLHCLPSGAKGNDKSSCCPAPFSIFMGGRWFAVSNKVTSYLCECLVSSLRVFSLDSIWRECFDYFTAFSALIFRPNFPSPSTAPPHFPGFSCRSRACVFLQSSRGKIYADIAYIYRHLHLSCQKSLTKLNLLPPLVPSLSLLPCAISF